MCVREGGDFKIRVIQLGGKEEMRIIHFLIA